MMKRELPRGIRIDHGYVQIRIVHNGIFYHRNFGLDSPLARDLAQIHLAEKRREILMGSFGIQRKIPKKRFDEVADIFFALWCKELNSDGSLAHNENSQYAASRVIKADLNPYFGKFWFDSIKPIQIERYREVRMRTVLGTTANREQVVLSSIFSHIAQWIALEKIKPFQIPKENPCEHIDKAPVRKRQRIPTEYELKKIKWAFSQLNDLGGWEICKLALKSVLSLSDLRKLEISPLIDLERSKTGVPVKIPIPVLQKLDLVNWRKRLERALTLAGLKHPLNDPRNLQLRDFRKWGINQLKDSDKQHNAKHISQYAGHASEKTTEEFYYLKDAKHLQPLADDLSDKVDSI